MTGPEQIVRLIQAGHLDESVRTARTWAEEAPGDVEAWQHLGVALAHAGEFEAAHEALDQGLKLQPKNHILLAEKGFVFFGQGRFSDAAESYRSAMDKGSNPLYRNGYGNALMHSGQMAAAARVLAEVVAADPAFMPARLNLVQAYLQGGDVRSARRVADEAVALAPRDYHVRDAAVWPLLYDDTTTPDELIAAHRVIGALLSRQRDPRSFPNNRSPERRLRLGFVSPDFREHSVYRFIWPVLEALADHPVDLYAYASSTNQDRGTEHVASLVKKYEDVTALRPEAFAKLVANDKIDVLFDLAGHTLLNRLVDFSIRLAPLHINWIGYPYSTGVPAMDFRIVDHFTDPQGSWTSEAQFVLNPCFTCFGMPRELPDIEDLTDGPTFGSFNVLAKASPTTVKLYADCLKSVPGSKLILKAQALDEEECRSNLLARFSAEGVDPSRIETFGRLDSYLDHLALYNRVTVALDPYPYHGTTTTCEAYAMGVPVVSLVGHTHQARVGLSLANAVGHPEWACESITAYVDTAKSLATKWSATDRKQLRAQLATSQLTNADDMAERLMLGVRAAWRAWCDLR